MSAQLPRLGNSPTRYPASCVSLSANLIDFLNLVLPSPPSVTLSVGSGPGLLEALLLREYRHRADTKSFFGVEVLAQTPVNRYLPEDNLIVVPGTWAVASEAQAAAACIFVYPRQPSLVAEYLNRGTRLRIVIWIGPKGDKNEYYERLSEWGTEDHRAVEDIALGESEEMVLFRRELSTDASSISPLDISLI